MIRFDIHTLATTPEKSIDTLKNSKDEAGFIPNMHGIMAESPVLLKAYKDIGNEFLVAISIIADSYSKLFKPRST